MSTKRRPIRRRCSQQPDAELAPSATDPEALVVRPQRARKMLGDIGESTFWKLAKAGEFEVIRVGPNLTLVTVASLRDFLTRYTAA